MEESYLTNHVTWRRRGSDGPLEDLKKNIKQFEK